MKWKEGKKTGTTDNHIYAHPKTEFSQHFIAVAYFKKVQRPAANGTYDANTQTHEHTHTHTHTKRSKKIHQRLLLLASVAQGVALTHAHYNIVPLAREPPARNQTTRWRSRPALMMRFVS